MCTIGLLPKDSVRGEVNLLRFLGRLFGVGGYDGKAFFCIILDNIQKSSRITKILNIFNIISTNYNIIIISEYLQRKQVHFQQMHNQGFVSVVHEGVLGLSRLARHSLTVSVYLCSSGSNAQGELRAREGRSVSSKSPSRVRDRDEEVAGRNGRE